LKNSLAGVLKQWVTPLLVDAGFRKVGSAYRLETSDGGLAVVDARLFPLIDDLVIFILEMAVAPPILVQFELRNEAEPVVGKLEWAGWSRRLRPAKATIEVCRPLLGRSSRLWEIDPMWVLPKYGDAEVCGQDLQTHLARVVPELLPMLSPSVMLTVLRSGEPPPYAVPLNLSPEWLEALLMLGAEGNSPNLQVLMDRIERTSPDNEVTPWIRAQLASSE